MNIRTYTRVALFAALLSVSAWIAVPSVPPLTLQTLVLFLAALTLSPEEALGAAGVYLALGAVGLPVFSALRGGIGHLAGLQGGFLIGFLPAAWLTAALRGRTPPRHILACALGLGVLYLCGGIGYLLHGMPLGTAVWSVLPFLPPDAAKIAVAAVLARALRRYVL